MPHSQRLFLVNSRYKGVVAQFTGLKNAIAEVNSEPFALVNGHVLTVSITSKNGKRIYELVLKNSKVILLHPESGASEQEKGLLEQINTDKDLFAGTYLNERDYFVAYYDVFSKKLIMHQNQLLLRDMDITLVIAEGSGNISGVIINGEFV